jgi:hypothetical protein
MGMANVTAFLLFFTAHFINAAQIGYRCGTIELGIHRDSTLRS